MRLQTMNRLARAMLLVCSPVIVLLGTGCPNTIQPDDTEPPPGQPVDTDGDGIADDNDQCPGTPAGVTVDMNGCDPTAGTNLDSDNDGVNDVADLCPDTPAGAIVDEDGCEVTAPGDSDSDGDGVIDDDDRCPDTPVGVSVDRFGCPDGDGGNGGGGGGGGGTTPVCGNEVVEVGETCDAGGASATCDIDCTAVECGDGLLNTAAGEQCDPPDGTTCDGNCRLISTGNFTADNCADAPDLFGEGAFSMNNSSATQDGPPHTGCVRFGEDQLDRDVWGCWTAPCTSTVFVQTCNLTNVDTRIAVYEGCTCPVTDARLLSCNDDRCDLQSLTTFEATAGQSYLIRVGAFPGEPGGVGSVSITCGLDACPGTGDCFAANGSPGCSDGTCCETTCNIDPFCCDNEWDDICAQEAAGLCTGGFASCQAGAGDCTVEKNAICRGGANDGLNCGDDNDCPDGGCMGLPGCGDVDCCNTICQLDPFCCINTWDEFCVGEEAEFCFTACGAGSGDCFTARPAGSELSGCEDIDCCAEVCPRDIFCCQVEWDSTCAESAAELCTPSP